MATLIGTGVAVGSAAAVSAVAAGASVAAAASLVCTAGFALQAARETTSNTVSKIVINFFMISPPICFLDACLKPNCCAWELFPDLWIHSNIEKKTTTINSNDCYRPYFAVIFQCRSIEPVSSKRSAIC
jgi:hypothetical protein